MSEGGSFPPKLAANGEEKMLHRIFKALADPTRLRILNLLMESPLCVCDFGSMFCNCPSH